MSEEASPTQLPEIDKVRALEILDKVVAFPETAITHQTDLSMLGGVAYPLVRKALRLIGEGIINNHPEKHIKGTSYKDLPDGTLVRLRVIDGKLINLSDMPSFIDLALMRGGEYLIEVKVPLQDHQWNPLDVQPGFFDYRHGGNPRWENEERRESIEGLRHSWRGVRFMAINLKNWEGEFILPESLDGLRLNAGTPKQIG